MKKTKTYGGKNGDETKRKTPQLSGGSAAG
jgi:hypothetical protein